MTLDSCHSSHPARVVIVPGLAVRAYIRDAVVALRACGVRVDVIDPPGGVNVPSDLRAHGLLIGRRLRDEPAAVLVGLSIGTQSAAVAAREAGDAVGRLVLASPTVAPQLRGRGRLLARWFIAGRKESLALTAQQVPEWLHAGPRRIARTLVSTSEAVLEDILPSVVAPVTIVRGSEDDVCPHTYALRLAADVGAALRIVPGGTHSWPRDDPDGFVRVVTEALA